MPMTKSTPLKYCYHGQHSRPASSFKRLPGARKREVCADCYAKIMADRKKKKVVGATR